MSCCEGINGTIFAYGQTASGKTYTMLGTSNDPGIVLLSLSEIFQYIRSQKDRQFALRIGYVEIHNEMLIDLLNPDNKKLKIIDDPEKGGCIIQHCTEIPVQNPQDVVELLLHGETARYALMFFFYFLNELRFFLLL